MGRNYEPAPIRSAQARNLNNSPRCRQLKRQNSAAVMLSAGVPQ